MFPQSIVETLGLPLLSRELKVLKSFVLQDLLQKHPELNE